MRQTQQMYAKLPLESSVAINPPVHIKLPQTRKPESLIWPSSIYDCRGNATPHTHLTHLQSHWWQGRSLKRGLGPLAVTPLLLRNTISNTPPFQHHSKKPQLPGAPQDLLHPTYLHCFSPAADGHIQQRGLGKKACRGPGEATWVCQEQEKKF